MEESKSILAMFTIMVGTQNKKVTLCSSNIFRIEAGKADKCSGMTTRVLDLAISMHNSKL